MLSNDSTSACTYFRQVYDVFTILYSDKISTNKNLSKSSKIFDKKTSNFDVFHVKRHSRKDCVTKLIIF